MELSFGHSASSGAGIGTRAEASSSDGFPASVRARALFYFRLPLRQSNGQLGINLLLKEITWPMHFLACGCTQAPPADAGSRIQWAMSDRLWAFSTGMALARRR
jgi:hypothetical protein